MSEVLPTVEGRKLEHDRPPAPNQSKEENQHKSSYVHVPTLWSLLDSLGTSILFSIADPPAPRVASYAPKTDLPSS